MNGQVPSIMHVTGVMLFELLKNTAITLWSCHKCVKLSPFYFTLNYKIFSTKLVRQIIGILIDLNCAPLVLI